MEIAKEHFKHCDLFKVVGRVDSQTSPKLAEVFNDSLESGQYKIIFDMSDVDFVSSAGLRVLINTQKQCKAKRGELVLASVPERIYEALDMAGFIPLFRITEDVVHAIGNL